MNWEAFGSIAEGLGAAGVIATLLYLVLQLRTNNQLLRSECERVSTQITVEAGLAIAENREVAELFSRGLADPSVLDGTDKGRFSWLMAGVISGGQLADSDWELGLVTRDDLGDTQAAYATILDTPGGSWWWERNKSAYKKHFIQSVERDFFSR